MNETASPPTGPSLREPVNDVQRRLLRLIAGLEAVSAGRVFIGSADVTDVRPQDRDLAMVFQNYALYPHMTVAGNLAFGLRLRRIPKAERARRALEVARKLALEELLDRKPSELSGGQRQRSPWAGRWSASPRRS
jgi:multiple sugar transport system ATP-binding protein